MTDEQSPITQSAAGMEAFEKIKILTSPLTVILLVSKQLNKMLKRFI